MSRGILYGFVRFPEATLVRIRWGWMMMDFTCRRTKQTARFRAAEWTTGMGPVSGHLWPDHPTAELKVFLGAGLIQRQIMPLLQCTSTAEIWTGNRHQLHHHWCHWRLIKSGAFNWQQRLGLWDGFYVLNQGKQDNEAEEALVRSDWGGYFNTVLYGKKQ